MFVLKVKSKLNCHDFFSVCGLAAHEAFVLQLIPTRSDRDTEHQFSFCA